MSIAPSSSRAASMEPRRNTVIDPLDQPRYGVVSCGKHHVVLQHVIEVDEPSPVVVDDSD
jgi:hypothetical protein